MSAAVRTGGRPVPATGERFGLVLVAAGIILGLLGTYLAIYTDCLTLGAACTHPYEAGGLPLEIAGVAFLLVGSAVWSVAFLGRPRRPPTPYLGNPDNLTVVPIGPSLGAFATQGMIDGFRAGVRAKQGPPPVCEQCGVPLPGEAIACPQCGRMVDPRPLD